MAQKKIVTELSKVLDQVVNKSKASGQSLLQNFRSQSEADPSISAAPVPLGRNELAEKARRKLESSLATYEDVIGIKQVKEAHSRVLLAETMFVKSQEERRSAQRSLTEVQGQLRLLRVEIDRTARGDEQYLELIKKEIDLVREERLLRTHFEDLEKRERELFSELSNALRFSHEKERAQNEKTKYWSVFGSVLGACLGIVGATINARLKQQHTQAILAHNSAQVEKLEKAVMTLVEKMQSDKKAEFANTMRVVATYRAFDNEIRAQEKTKAEKEEPFPEYLKLKGFLPVAHMLKDFEEDKFEWQRTVFEVGGGLLLMFLLSRLN